MEPSIEIILLVFSNQFRFKRFLQLWTYTGISILEILKLFYVILVRINLPSAKKVKMLRTGNKCKKSYFAKIN